MATAILNFATELPHGLQVNDFVFSSNSTTTSGGFTVASGAGVFLGTVNSINSTTVQSDGSAGSNFTLETDLTQAGLNAVTSGATNALIFFAKDNAINMSSILGYYAEVKMTNTSAAEAELYQVSTEMFESSK